MRSMDWSATPIGAPESWTPTLRIMVRVLLANRFPMLLWWGPQYCQFYNDPYRPVLGDKHPKSMGQPASECFPEIWPTIGPLIDTPYRGGPATWMDDLEVEYIRHDLLEEAHFTIAYSPVPDDTVPGGIGGVLATVHEITQKVVAERRVRLLRDISARSAQAKTAETACSLVAETLSQEPKDIPFSVIYLADQQRKCARLAAAAGVSSGSGAAPVEIDLASPMPCGHSWPLREAILDDTVRVVDDLQQRLTEVPPGPWANPPRSAAILPIRSGVSQQPAGFLVVGISSRLRFDDAYRGFCELLTSQVAAAIANARAHDEARRKAEAMAEIDRAKTAFFSNVSHEFRTPLRLILAPVEEMASRAQGAITVSREDLDLIRRNTLRALKLVNALLDFSRIEAGRMAACYEPVELSAFTAELAGVFRSAIEQAGLRLSVACVPLGEPVYVDRAMWEKIVLNFLSNAFKFTFEGEIAVALRRHGQYAELTVSDTGIGIPEHEIPHLFERFHRVEGARGRTYEGSGIGLALVQELVRLHGGNVQVQSSLGFGSRFVIAIPLGRAHLPPEHVTGAEQSHTAGARAYIEEALHWLPDPANDDPVEKDQPLAEPGSSEDHSGGAPIHRPLILLADDNADMRQYLRRMLAASYEVRSVSDGESALAEALRNPPDLVLADVMMPRMDGFALLGALRSHPGIANIPVILLSARAGEESRVEGLERGADDYIVKPFSARELLARVSARLEIAQLNRATLREQDLRRRAEEAERHTKIILESITDAFVAVDRDWRYTYVNAAAERDKGLGRREMLGRTMWEMFPGAASTIFEREFRRSMTERIPVLFETYFASMDRWIAASAYPSEDGGLAIYFRDVTREKRAELALVEKERFINQIADLTPAVITVWDLTKGHETYISRGVSRLIGYMPEEIAAMKDPFSTLCHPDDILSCRSNLARLRASPDGENIRMEYRVRRRDGEWRWLGSRVTPFSRNTDGEVSQFIAATVDFTGRKRAEEALRASEERFRRYFELGLVGMAISSPEKGFLEVNDEICRILGYQRSELLRTTWAEITHPDDVAANVALFQRVMAGEIDSYTLDKRWVRKDRRVIDSTISVTCVRREDGSVDYFLALLQDITARKRAEKALAKSHAKLELRVTRRTRQLSDLNQELLQQIGERKRAELESLALKDTLAAELAAMTRLHELSKRLLANVELRPLLQEVLNATVDLQKADFGAAQLYHAETGVLELVVHRGFQREFLDRFALVGDAATACGRAQRLRQRVIIEDVNADPAFEPLRAVAASTGFRAVQSTPFFSRSGELLGVISTHFRQPHRPSEHELRLTDLYAVSAADAIEQKRAAAAVLSYQQELEKLASKLIEAQETGRKFLARELHDDFSQKLAVLGMDLAALATGPYGSSQDLRGRLMNHAAQIGALTNDIHRVSHQLHPAILDDLGLAAALENECTAFSQRHGIAAPLALLDIPPALPEDVSLCLFRVAQECLHNTAEHAGATEVRVVLYGSTDGIAIEISDNGRGVSCEVIRGRRGLGLISMEERARLVNGTFSIRSEPGKGTSVKVVVPLPAIEL